MITSYGTPPAYEDCLTCEPPDGLKLKLDQTVMLPTAVEMHPQLGRRASVMAVARQLLQAFDFGRVEPVRVQVKGYGEFLIGPDGWCLRG